MIGFDKPTLENVLNEIQKIIDENYPCDNIDQRIGYKLALYKMYNHVFSMKIRQD